MFSNYTYLYKIAQRVFQFFQYFKWRATCNFRKLGNSFEFDLIYSVKTDDIILCTEKEYDPYVYDGARLDGDWDISTKKFCNLNAFIAFTDHFLHNIAWEDTHYYKIILNKIQAGYVLWRCANEKSLRQRFESFDVLYEKIKVNGYTKQTELLCQSYTIKKIDEISVNLDRNGKLLFNNSVHRLAIAKILGIESIPVRVTVCHEKCNNFNGLYFVGKG